MMFPIGRALACLLGAGLIALPAQAENKVRVAIGAGPAAAALTEFARQTGIEVLASGELLAGVRTRALAGEFTPLAALARLLDGTGLKAQRSASGAVLLERLPPRPVREEVAQVLVVGTRASEQSSIARKQQAATALDAIVADDVASFPDNNVAEAVSRIAGVALERGEFGEGNYVSVRGNGPEAIRVEMDGMAVLAGGGTNLNGAGGGRGVELRELPADLIASVDVVKGSTADMTEGGIGGSILIRTRTGLDFRKRSFSVRTAAQANSLNRRWTPNLNVFFADRSRDGRLGVVANIGRSGTRNEAHQMQVGANNTGYLRDLDLDQSPDKTFALNPAALSPTDPLVHQPLASYPAGGATFSTLTPAQIVERAGAARTKAECHQAFPWYTEAELAPLSAANRAQAQNIRGGELRSCLNQWNDYLPGVTRYFVKTQVDERVNADLRVDYKASPALTVYAKINRSRRGLDDTINALSPGNPTTTSALNTPGYFVYPGNLVNRGIVGGVYQGLSDGIAANIVPGSVEVDANHHATRLTISGAGLNNDVIATRIGTHAATSQAGASWRGENLRADLLAGRSSADFYRYGLRSSLSFLYGQVTMQATPDGLWSYQFPSPGPLGAMADVNNYGVVTPNADPRQPARGPLTQLTLDNPRAAESREDNLRLDLSYALKGALGPLERLRFGLNRRAYDTLSWGAGGYTVSSGGGGTVVLPTLAVRSGLQACEDALCRYGVSYSGNAATRFNSTITVTQQQYRDMVGQALAGTTAPFFRGASSRPAGIDGWTMFDAAKVFELSGVQHMNLDCIRSCIASDGQRYDQPRAQVSERIGAGYLSTEFGTDRNPLTGRPLPWGMEVSGNAGWRYVRTRVEGTGLATFRTVRKDASYAQDGAVTALTLAQNTTLARRTTDLMPVLNLAATSADERLVLRYHRARTIARPAVGYLISSGVTCSHDERLAQLEPCDGTIGNPALPAHRSRNRNLSLEWYPDRQSQLSVSLFRQDGTLGEPRRVLVENARPFAGQGAIDAPYTYVTWAQGLPGSRRGVELAARSAFGMLPWYLRYTGASANIWNVRWDNEMPIRELASAAELPPISEIRYSWAASLWYDDGALSMRAALQVNSWSFSRFQNLGGSFPATGWSGELALPFMPAAPLMRDARRFVDARIGYKFRNGVELFAEARNLGKTSVSNSNGDFAQFEHNRALIDLSYSGTRYMVGMVIRQR